MSFSSATDPSATDEASLHYAFACDYGSLAGATYAGSGASSSTTCTYNDNGTSTVRARVIDKDGGHSEYTTDVVVTNVAPTATLTVPAAPVAEGSSFTVSLDSASDPSSVDTTAGFRYAFASDGEDLTATYATGSATASTSCSYDDGASTHTVRGRILDKDGGFNDYSTTVSATNVAPVSSLSNNGPINEGSSATITFGAVTDPSTTDTTAGFHYAFACAGAPSTPPPTAAPAPPTRPAAPTTTTAPTPSAAASSTKTAATANTPPTSSSTTSPPPCLSRVRRRSTRAAAPPSPSPFLTLVTTPSVSPPATRPAAPKARWCRSRSRSPPAVAPSSASSPTAPPAHHDEGGRQ